jgi:hypothetical protein
MLLVSICFGATNVSAEIVTLEFSGIYELGAANVFGETGAAPFLYSIKYDTALNTNTEFFDTGAIIEGAQTTHPWHGYSAAGIIDSSLTFGTKTFSPGSIQTLVVPPGASADLWFDTDISLAAPTRSWIYFFDGEGSLQLGSGLIDGTDIYFAPISLLGDNSGFSVVSPTLSIVAIPEPASASLLGIAATLASTRRGRRDR